MIRGVKILRDVLMALLARLTTNKGRALDVRWNNDGPLHSRTGNHRHGRGDPEQANDNGRAREFSPGWWVCFVHKIYGLERDAFTRTLARDFPADQ